MQKSQAHTTTRVATRRSAAPFLLVAIALLLASAPPAVAAACTTCHGNGFLNPNGTCVCASFVSLAPSSTSLFDDCCLIQCNERCDGVRDAAGSCVCPLRSAIGAESPIARSDRVQWRDGGAPHTLQSTCCDALDSITSKSVVGLGSLRLPAVLHSIHAAVVLPGNELAVALLIRVACVNVTDFFDTFDRLYAPPPTWPAGSARSRAPPPVCVEENPFDNREKYTILLAHVHYAEVLAITTAASDFDEITIAGAARVLDYALVPAVPGAVGDLESRARPLFTLDSAEQWCVGMLADPVRGDTLVFASQAVTTDWNAGYAADLPPGAVWLFRQPAPSAASAGGYADFEPVLVAAASNSSTVVNRVRLFDAAIDFGDTERARSPAAVCALAHEWVSSGLALWSSNLVEVVRIDLARLPTPPPVRVTLTFQRSLYATPTTRMLVLPSINRVFVIYLTEEQLGWYGLQLDDLSVRFGPEIRDLTQGDLADGAHLLMHADSVRPMHARADWGVLFFFSTAALPRQQVVRMPLPRALYDDFPEHIVRELPLADAPYVATLFSPPQSADVALGQGALLEFDEYTGRAIAVQTASCQISTVRLTDMMLDIDESPPRSGKQVSPNFECTRTGNPLNEFLTMLPILPLQRNAPHLSTSLTSAVLISRANKPLTDAEPPARGASVEVGVNLHLGGCVAGSMANKSISQCALARPGVIARNTADASGSFLGVCPEGTTSLPGCGRFDECVPCPSGTYAPEPGSPRCLPCANDTYCPLASSTPLRTLLSDDGWPLIEASMPPFRRAQLPPAALLTFANTLLGLCVAVLLVFVVLALRFRTGIVSASPAHASLDRTRARKASSFEYVEVPSHEPLLHRRSGRSEGVVDDVDGDADAHDRASRSRVSDEAGGARSDEDDAAPARDARPAWWHLRVLPLLAPWDALFSREHYSPLRRALVRRRTAFGGLLTLATVVMIATLVLRSSLQYAYDAGVWSNAYRPSATYEANLAAKLPQDIDLWFRAWGASHSLCGAAAPADARALPAVGDAQYSCDGVITHREVGVRSGTSQVLCYRLRSDTDTASAHAAGAPPDAGGSCVVHWSCRQCQLRSFATVEAVFVAAGVHANVLQVNVSVTSPSDHPLDAHAAPSDPSARSLASARLVPGANTVLGDSATSAFRGRAHASFVLTPALLLDARFSLWRSLFGDSAAVNAHSAELASVMGESSAIANNDVSFRSFGFSASAVSLEAGMAVTPSPRHTEPYDVGFFPSLDTSPLSVAARAASRTAGSAAETAYEYNFVGPSNATGVPLGVQIDLTRDVRTMQVIISDHQTFLSFLGSTAGLVGAVLGAATAFMRFVESLAAMRLKAAARAATAAAREAPAQPMEVLL